MQAAYCCLHAGCETNCCSLGLQRTMSEGQAGVEERSQHTEPPMVPLGGGGRIAKSFSCLESQSHLSSPLSCQWLGRHGVAACTMSSTPWPLSMLAWEVDHSQNARKPAMSTFSWGKADRSLRWGLGLGLPSRSAREQGACFVVSEEKLLSDGMLVEAREASDEDLLVVHTRRYLNELKV